MSATLVSSNTTIKVNTFVDSNRTSTGLVYTAPSNGYAIVNIEVNCSAGSIELGDGNINVLSVAAAATGRVFGYYIGAGLGFYVTFSGGGSGNVHIRGVEFVNTP